MLLVVVGEPRVAVDEALDLFLHLGYVFMTQSPSHSLPACPDNPCAVALLRRSYFNRGVIAHDQYTVIRNAGLPARFGPSTWQSSSTQALVATP